MTYDVSSGMLNCTHSLTHSFQQSNPLCVVIVAALVRDVTA